MKESNKIRPIPVKDGRYYGFIPMGREFVTLDKDEQDKWIKFVLSNSEGKTFHMEWGRRDCEEK